MKVSVMQIWLGIGGVVILSIVCAISWLLWPLPQGEFDWQRLVDTELESGNCENAATILTVIGTALDNPEIGSQLDQISSGELCTIGGGRDAADVVEQIRWSHGIMPRIHINEFSFLSGLSFASYRRSQIRQLREEAGVRVAWFTDTVIIYRCVRVFSDFDQGTWFHMRAELYAATNLAQPSQAWLRRQQYCLDLIDREIEGLEGSDQSKQTLQLIDEYEMMRLGVDERSEVNMFD